MTAEEMWALYTRGQKIDAPYEAWAFCGGGEAGDRLARLVLNGTKTATSSPLIAYQTEGIQPPEEGCCSVVLYDDGQAACVIRTGRVSIVPFLQVSERHAWLEGEGDRSLTYWRTVHREAFEPDYKNAGLDFDENGLCVLEEFKVVFP